MSFHTYTMADIISPITPSRLFQALSIDNHNFANNLPKFVKSIELVHGDSTTVGCIKQVNLPDGSPVKYVKNRVDEIDFDKHYVKYTSFEGDVLGDALECVIYENKFEGSGSGCHFTMVGHYYTKGNAVIKEEEITEGRESIKQLFKAVDEFLLANPELYA